MERFPGETGLLLRNFSGYALAFRKAADAAFNDVAEKESKE